MTTGKKYNGTKKAILYFTRRWPKTGCHALGCVHKYSQSVLWASKTPHSHSHPTRHSEFPSTALTAWRLCDPLKVISKIEAVVKKRKVDRKGHSFHSKWKLAHFSPHWNMKQLCLPNLPTGCSCLGNSRAPTRWNMQTTTGDWKQTSWKWKQLKDEWLGHTHFHLTKSGSLVHTEWHIWTTLCFSERFESSSVHWEHISKHAIGVNNAPRYCSKSKSDKTIQFNLKLVARLCNSYNARAFTEMIFFLDKLCSPICQNFKFH